MQPTPLATLESSEALVRLDRVLALLTPEKRETFLLAELEEMTAAEIGEVMSANVNTVYTRLRAAREEISAHYTKMFGDPNTPGGRDE